MSFRILPTTQTKPEITTYSPVWIYKGLNKDASNGTFTMDYQTAYKTVNVMDANGVNTRSWLNNLKIMITGSGPASFTPFVTGVDGESGDSYFITGISSISDNGDDTFTIGGGDILSGASLIEGQHITMSYFTK